MSKRSSWIVILVVVLLLAFLFFGGGHALWVMLLRMHGVRT
jgi:hypothetical protein